MHKPANLARRVPYPVESTPARVNERAFDPTLAQNLHRAIYRVSLPNGA